MSKKPGSGLGRTLAVIAAFAAGLAIVGGIGVTVYAVLYDPLDIGGGGGSGIDGDCVESSKRHDGSTIARVNYRHGGMVSMFLDLQNDGARSVRIEGIGNPSPGGFVTSTQAYLLDRNVGASCDWREGRPFEPFMLGPGKRAPVVVRGVLGDCRGVATGSSALHTAIPVRWKFGPFNETTRLPLNVGLEVGLERPADCPA